MARTLAELPKGARISDYISLGVLARTFPAAHVQRVLKATGTMSQRQRDLPAHVVVYYVIALALYMQASYREVLRCLLEGVVWLAGPTTTVRVTGKSGISQARTRLGWRPVKQLHDEVVRPVAAKATRGAWYRTWRVVTLDGSTLDVADTAANVQAFGRPSASRGISAYPQLRFVALVENGTHVLFGSELGRYAEGETTLAKRVLPALQPGMLCLADRLFFGAALWQQAHATGADLVWRIKHNLRFACQQGLAELAQDRVVSSRGRRIPRGVKRKMSNYPLRPRGQQPLRRITIQVRIRKPK